MSLGRRRSKRRQRSACSRCCVVGTSVITGSEPGASIAAEEAADVLEASEGFSVSTG